MTNEEWYNQLTTEEKNILELVKEDSTPIEVLEEIVAKYPNFPNDPNAYVEELVECLTYHPNSSANILGKIFSNSYFRHEYETELANHPNMKKRGVKTKKHPLRGKNVYVVMHSHSDGCDSYVYAEEEHADAKEAQLERKLGGGDGCVWIEAQEIK